MKRVKLKTTDLGKGRKVFLTPDENWQYSFEESNTTGGFSAPEEDIYHFLRPDGTYIVKTTPFDEWGLSSGGIKDPYRRNYIDIDFNPGEITEFGREEWWFNLPFNNGFPFVSQREGRIYIFHNKLPEEDSGGVSCFDVEGNMVWGFRLPTWDTFGNVPYFDWGFFLQDVIVGLYEYRPAAGVQYIGLVVIDYEGNVLDDEPQKFTFNQSSWRLEEAIMSGLDSFYYEVNHPDGKIAVFTKVDASGIVSETNTSPFGGVWFGQNYTHFDDTGFYHCRGPFTPLTKHSHENASVIWTSEEADGFNLVVSNPYNDTLLGALYFGTIDGWETSSEDAKHIIVEIDKETGLLLRHVIDEGGDPDNSFIQHGAFLNENTFVWYDYDFNDTTNNHLLVIVWFDTEKWEVRGRMVIDNISTWTAIRALPPHFRNEKMIFPVYNSENTNASTVVVVDSQGNVDVIISERYTGVNVYTDIFFSTYDGKVIIGEGSDTDDEDSPSVMLCV